MLKFTTSHGSTLRPFRVVLARSPHRTCFRALGEALAHINPAGRSRVLHESSSQGSGVVWPVGFMAEVGHGFRMFEVCCKTWGFGFASSGPEFPRTP